MWGGGGGSSVDTALIAKARGGHGFNNILPVFSLPPSLL